MFHGTIDSAACQPATGDRPDRGTLLLAASLAAAADGDARALHDLGVIHSTGGPQTACDLVEAHKWFNLAAARGHDPSIACRADIAAELSPRQIAQAQRRAREWLAAGPHPA